MVRRRAALAIGCFGSIACSSALAFAQAPPENKPGRTAKSQTAAVVNDDDDEKRTEGWAPGIDIGTSFNVVDSRSVVGQPNGTTLTLGAHIDASLELNHNIHEWRSTLKLEGGVTKTPAIDEFEKSNDELDFESIYLLHALPIFGPYARVALHTTMFPATDLEPKAVTYVVTNLDGTTSTFIGRRLGLTDAFQPLTLREGIGAFVQPIDEEDRIELELKGGLGSEQTIAKGVALADDSATPVIEAKELGNTYAVGAEAVADLWGYFDATKRVAYTLGVDVLFPFKTSDLPAGDDRSLIELTRVEIDAGLDAKIFDWASISYKLGVLREPLIVDKWQVSNSLLFNIGGAWGTKAPKPPKPACDCTKDCKPAVAKEPAE